MMLVDVSLQPVNDCSLSAQLKPEHFMIFSGHLFEMHGDVKSNDEAGNLLELKINIITNSCKEKNILILRSR